jgi:hypothetical protein
VLIIRGCAQTIADKVVSLADLRVDPLDTVVACFSPAGSDNPRRLQIQIGRRLADLW